MHCAGWPPGHAARVDLGTFRASPAIQICYVGACLCGLIRAPLGCPEYLSVRTLGSVPGMSDQTAFLPPNTVAIHRPTPMLAFRDSRLGKVPMKAVSISAALVGCVVAYCHPLALAQTKPLAPEWQIASPAGTFTSNPIFRNGFELLTWRVRKSATTSLLVVPCSSGQCPPQLGVESDIPQPADYDGDGRDDIATWRSLDATWRVQLTVANTMLATIFGAPGDVPIAGDYDGDFVDDRAVWNPNDGSWRVLRSSTGTMQVVPCLNGFCGAFGDQPVRGDFDGDGKDDFAIWRPSIASWIIQLNAGGALITQPWGAAGDIPIAEDYDGDGETDIALWRPSNATWIIRSSGNGGSQYTPPCASGFCTTLFGAAGDIPQVGDFDGDGKADLIVWRPTDGTWRQVNSSNGSDVIVTWGVNGDSPQPGDYDGDGKTDLAVLQK